MKTARANRSTWVALGLWFVSGCGGLAAVDLNADQDPSTTPGSSSYEAACTQRDDACNWVITECKAEPACARWYACVSACTPDNASTCFAQCKDTSTPPTNSSQLLQCLQSGCVEGSKEVGGEAGSDSNGGAPSWGDAGPELGADASEDNPPASGSVWDSCYSCLYSGQSDDGSGAQNCMAACNSGCEKALIDCNGKCGNDTGCIEVCKDTLSGCTSACGTAGTYKHVLLEKTNEMLDGTHDGCMLQTDWHEFEKCLYSVQKDWVSHETHAQFASSGLWACVMDQCAGKCFPEKYIPCADCLKTKCAAQSKDYWTSAAAQDFGWCYEYGPQLGEPDCSAYADLGGDAIYTEFVMCREQNCYDSCK